MRECAEQCGHHMLAHFGQSHGLYFCPQSDGAHSCAQSDGADVCAQSDGVDFGVSLMVHIFSESDVADVVLSLKVLTVYGVMVLFHSC